MKIYEDINIVLDYLNKKYETISEKLPTALLNTTNRAEPSTRAIEWMTTLATRLRSTKIKSTTTSKLLSIKLANLATRTRTSRTTTASWATTAKFKSKTSPTIRVFWPSTTSSMLTTLTTIKPDGDQSIFMAVMILILIITLIGLFGFGLISLYNYKKKEDQRTKVIINIFLNQILNFDFLFFNILNINQ